jgi:hypothetical protein
MIDFTSDPLEIEEYLESQGVIFNTFEQNSLNQADKMKNFDLFMKLYLEPLERFLTQLFFDANITTEERKSLERKYLQPIRNVILDPLSPESIQISQQNIASIPFYQEQYLEKPLLKLEQLEPTIVEPEPFENVFK